MTYWIERATAYLNMVTGGNEMLSAMIGAWLLGVATYLLRNVPKMAYVFIKRQLITTVRIDNGDYTKRSILIRLMQEHHKNTLFRFTRNFDFETSYMGDDKEMAQWGLGYGLHFLWLGGRLFWIHKEKTDSQATNFQKYELKLSTFGRSVDPFKPLLGRLNKEKEKGTFVYAHMGRGWVKVAPMRPKSINSVITQDDVLPKMIDIIDTWQDSREEYDMRGLDYRLNFLLHGVPGTGKTSIAKVLSHHYRMNVYILDLSTLFSTSIAEIFSEMDFKRGFILLIEDFDLNCAVKKRKEGDDGAERSPEKLKLNLSHVLNLLDGVVPLDNIITIMTTNHLNKVDPAIYRKGRVDHMFEVKPLEGEYISRYVELVSGYRGSFEGKVRGCDLQAAYLENRGDTDSFVSAVKNLCMDSMPS